MDDAFRSRTQKLLRMLRACSLVLPFVICTYWAWHIWTEKTDIAEQTARKNVRLVSDYTHRVLQIQRLLLDRVDELLAQPDAQDTEALSAKLAAAVSQVNFTRSVVVLDAEGTVIAASHSRLHGMSAADRDYFHRLRENRDAGLVIDRVAAQQHQLDLLVMTRRRAGSSFEGAIVASVEMPVLHEFYVGIAPLSEKAAVALIREDGRVLIRNRLSDRPITLPPTAPPMDVLPTQSSGSYTTTAIIDGITRRYAFMQVGDLPLYANVGVALTEIRASALQDILPVGVALLALALIAWFGLTQLSRRLEADAAFRKAELDSRLLDEAKRSVELQETLFREVNHRIRNNLLTIQTLIRMEARKGAEQMDLGRVEQRIWAIAEVHNLLYSAGPSSTIDFGAFLRTLCNNPSIAPPERDITVLCEAGSLEVDIQQAVPVAIIVVELITNAVKHAFPGKSAGQIIVKLSGTQNSGTVAVKDTGIGMPAARQRHSGFKLVSALVRQIGGRFEIAVQNGTEVTLVFPLRPGGEGQPAQTRLLHAVS